MRNKRKKHQHPQHQGDSSDTAEPYSKRRNGSDRSRLVQVHEPEQREQNIVHNTENTEVCRGDEPPLSYWLEDGEECENTQILRGIVNLLFVSALTSPDQRPISYHRVVDKH
jgi:hypothetical protein